MKHTDLVEMPEKFSRINKVIIDNIRKIMAEKGLSNSDIVKLTGIPAGTVSKILNLQLKVTTDRLYEFRKGFCVPITTLLEGLDNVTSNARPSPNLSTNNNILNVGILSIGDRRLCIAKDERDNIIGESELADSLVLTDPLSVIFNNIKKSLAVALEKTTDLEVHEMKNINLAIVVHCYEFEETRIKYCTQISRYFRNVNILSDWQITYAAAFGNDEGISLVVDKGVSLSYMHNGKLGKLGGWGFPIYDLGGEYWLGTMTVRHTIQVAEGFTNKSRLSRTVMAKYEGKLEYLIEYCVKNMKDFDKYSEFCSMLIESYYAGGVAAKVILQAGFEEINSMINRIDTIVGKKLPISINGSLAHVYIHFLDQNRLIDPISDMNKASLLADIAKQGCQVI